MIDLPATLLEYFDVARPPDMQGIPLRAAVAHNAPTREAALFGIHGGQVNVTDGHYVYMRGPANADNAPLYEYTLMPTHMRQRFAVSELQEIELAEPFIFTKGCRTLKLPARSARNFHRFGTVLYDVHADPGQQRPLQDPEVEARMIGHLVRLMQENDAPPEQYARLGLPGG
jgi:hypothetical protein